MPLHAPKPIATRYSERKVPERRDQFRGDAGRTASAEDRGRSGNGGNPPGWRGARLQGEGHGDQGLSEDADGRLELGRRLEQTFRHAIAEWETSTVVSASARGGSGTSETSEVDSVLFGPLDSSGSIVEAGSDSEPDSEYKTATKLLSFPRYITWRETQRPVRNNFAVPPPPSPGLGSRCSSVPRRKTCISLSSSFTST